MAKKKRVPIRNRVKELRNVKASTLIPSPANWRMHPEAQRATDAGLTPILKKAGIDHGKTNSSIKDA